MKPFRFVAPLLAGTLALSNGIGIAQATAHILVGSPGAPIDLTEDDAAADMLGYHPDFNRIAPHAKGATGTKVTIIQRVPPHLWFYKYAYMRQWAAAHGTLQAKAPDDSEEDWLVEIRLPDGTKAWVSSSTLDPPH